MAAIVESWGLDARIVKIFEEQEIDEDTLAELDEATVKELLPIIGLRRTFLKKWTSVYGNLKPPIDTNSKNTRPEVEVDAQNSDDDTELERQDAFSGEISFQLRTKTLNIKNILSKSIQGKGILKSYKKSKTLSKKCRNQIVDLILSHILCEVNRLTNCDFEFLARKIIEVFPNEVLATYYVPPIPKRLSRGQSRSITSRGKLVDKYRNKLKEYKNITGSRVTDNCTHTPMDQNENTEDAEEIQTAVTWLSKYTAPWENVIEKWDLTREYRRKDITSNADTKVCTIFDRWPILKHPMGYTLLQRDYVSLKLSAVENNLETWSAFFADVENICQRNNDDSNLDALIELLKHDELNDDARVVIQLLMLPHLLPPKGRLRKNKKDWKPSIVECKNSIIVHAILPSDVTKVQEDRIAFAKKWGLCDQPFIIAVGPNLTTFSSFSVSIDKVLYQVKSALAALNICFEAFHALDAEYPVESQHLWLLIQKGLFKFTTKWDKSISYVEETLSMMSNLKKGNA